MNREIQIVAHRMKDLSYLCPKCHPGHEQQTWFDVGIQPNGPAKHWVCRAAE